MTHKDPPRTPKNPEKTVQKAKNGVFPIFHEIHEKPWVVPVLAVKILANPENPPFPFLYINPYDTGSIFFFSEKCALFRI